VVAVQALIIADRRGGFETPLADAEIDIDKDRPAFL
jgi:hypothetical protein